jgi:hypothetical protein
MPDNQYDLILVLPQEKDILEYLLYFKIDISGARKSNITTITKLSLEDELGNDYMWIASKYTDLKFNTVRMVFKKVLIN